MFTTTDYLNGNGTIIDNYDDLNTAIECYLELAYEADDSDLLQGHAIISDASNRPVVIIHYHAVKRDHPVCVVTHLDSASRSYYRYVETGDSYVAQLIY